MNSWLGCFVDCFWLCVAPKIFHTYVRVSVCVWHVASGSCCCSFGCHFGPSRRVASRCLVLVEIHYAKRTRAATRRVAHATWQTKAAPRDKRNGRSWWQRWQLRLPASQWGRSEEGGGRRGSYSQLTVACLNVDDRPFSITYLILIALNMCVHAAHGIVLLPPSTPLPLYTSLSFCSSVFPCLSLCLAHPFCGTVNLLSHWALPLARLGWWPSLVLLLPLPLLSSSPTPSLLLSSTSARSTLVPCVLPASLPLSVCLSRQRCVFLWALSGFDVNYPVTTTTTRRTLSATPPPPNAHMHNLSLCCPLAKASSACRSVNKTAAVARAPPLYFSPSLSSSLSSSALLCCWPRLSPRTYKSSH